MKVEVFCYCFLLFLGTHAEQLVPEERCMFLANPGPCYGKIKMFAYDPFEDSCKEFYYGGCGGNTNRFTSLEECQLACDAQDNTE